MDDLYGGDVSSDPVADAGAPSVGLSAPGGISAPTGGGGDGWTTPVVTEQNAVSGDSTSGTLGDCYTQEQECGADYNPLS
ncbi:MAG: hypothetical protein PHR35_18280 [Kiritimatiellae bacterium]|nr:hypothetical protein [Kiritimatiellia bacterium]